MKRTMKSDTINTGKTSSDWAREIHNLELQLKQAKEGLVTTQKEPIAKATALMKEINSKLQELKILCVSNSLTFRGWIPSLEKPVYYTDGVEDWSSSACWAENEDVI